MATLDELHARALDLLVDGDTAGGITDLRDYLAARPDDAAAWLELGAAYSAIDHLAQAEDALRRAIALDATSIEARLTLARLLGRVRRADAAAAALEEAIAIAPEDARLLEELGVSRYEARRYDEACHLLQRAVAIDPSDARAWYALGVAEEARREIGAAVAAWREATRADQAFTDARRTLADALASLGEHEAAIAELSAILAIDPSDAQAAKNREVLRRALAEMAQRRLIGKDTAALESSALIADGGFRKREEGRYTTALAEVHARLDAAGAIEALLLVITDPARATRTEDDTFRVTVITKDGRRAPTDHVTAITLTFLREALGCPLTRASAIYASLLHGETIEHAGAVAAFTSEPRHGLRVQKC